MERNFRAKRPMRDNNMFTPPVNVGDELNVRIEAVGAKGDGIARKDGFVLFVPGVNEGQDVRIRVTKVLRRVGFAEVVGDAPPKKEEAKPKEKKPEEEEYQPEEGVVDSEDFGEEKTEEKKGDDEEVDKLLDDELEKIDELDEEKTD